LDELLGSILVKVPSDRFTLSCILSHPFTTGARRATEKRPHGGVAGAASLTGIDAGGCLTEALLETLLTLNELKGQLATHGMPSA